MPLVFSATPTRRVRRRPATTGRCAPTRSPAGWRGWAGRPPQSVRVANVANALTLLRLLLVPVFAVLLLYADGSRTGWRIAAWAVFAVASITDRADGQLARSRGLVTEFGKLADPIADK